MSYILYFHSIFVISQGLSLYQLDGFMQFISKITNIKFPWRKAEIILQMWQKDPSMRHSGARWHLRLQHGLFNLFWIGLNIFLLSMKTFDALTVLDHNNRTYCTYSVLEYTVYISNKGFRCQTTVWDVSRGKYPHVSNTGNILSVYLWTCKPSSEIGEKIHKCRKTVNIARS